MPTDASRISAVLATEQHAGAIATFYREVWDPAATPASVLAAMRQASALNVAAPGSSVPTALVLAGDRVIGYCGSIPQQLWDGTRQRPAYWVKGLMVLPEYRNGPVGYLVVKELSRHLDCSTILTVAPAARRLFTALGYTDLGAVANWVRPLRPGVIAEKIDLGALGLDRLPRWMGGGVRAARRAGIAGAVGFAGGVVLDAAVRLARLPAARIATGIETPSAVELDQLWNVLRDELAASPVRDSAYLLPRFGEGGSDRLEHPYTFVAARERGRLLGVAAVRRPRDTSDPRLGSTRVASASELLFPSSRADAGLAILGAIERVARAAGADAVTCMTSHPALTSLLRRQGYLRLGGNVHFFLRDVTGAGHWPADLDAWWLGRGDGESDASF